MASARNPSKTVPAAPATKAAASTGAKKDASEGLRGIIAGDSAISLVDGANGRLLYRGYNIADLAEHSTFEETTYLLLNGELPQKAQLEAFSARLSAERELPSEALQLIEGLPKNVQPMDALRTVTSLMGALDVDANTTGSESRDRATYRIIARTGTALAAIQRHREGKPIVGPPKGGSHAAAFMQMLMGKKPDDFVARAMDVSLILHADHEFNASTFTARVTASTLSDLYSTVTGALGTLKGPLHGGANRAVMEQLVQIDKPESVAMWLEQRLAAQKKIMGFGHAVYKVMDPRAVVLKKWSLDAAKRAKETKWYEMSERLEKLVNQKKGLWPNVDFYSASLYKVLGIPLEVYPAIFAVSRVSGWLAHVREQLDNNKLIRPLSNYTGPQLRPYPKVHERA